MSTKIPNTGSPSALTTVLSHYAAQKPRIFIAASMAAASAIQYICLRAVTSIAKLALSVRAVVELAGACLVINAIASILLKDCLTLDPTHSQENSGQVPAVPSETEAQGPPHVAKPTSCHDLFKTNYLKTARALSVRDRLPKLCELALTHYEFGRCLSVLINPLVPGGKNPSSEPQYSHGQVVPVYPFGGKERAWLEKHFGIPSKIDYSARCPQAYNTMPRYNTPFQNLVNPLVNHGKTLVLNVGWKGCPAATNRWADLHVLFVLSMFALEFGDNSLPISFSLKVGSENPGQGDPKDIKFRQLVKDLDLSSAEGLFHLPFDCPTLFRAPDMPEVFYRPFLPTENSDLSKLQSEAKAQRKENEEVYNSPLWKAGIPDKEAGQQMLLDMYCTYWDEEQAKSLHVQTKEEVAFSACWAMLDDLEGLSKHVAIVTSGKIGTEQFAKWANDKLLPFMLEQAETRFKDDPELKGQIKAQFESATGFLRT